MSTRTSTTMDIPISSRPIVVNLPPRGRPQFAKNALSLNIAAALAAGMPPRAETLAKTIVGPEPKTPERLAAADARRERRNAKRLRDRGIFPPPVITIGEEEQP